MFHNWPTGLIWRLGLTGAAFAWMSLIFYLSSLSQAEASNIASRFGDIKSNAAHFALFGVLAALIQASFWGWRLGRQLHWAIAAAGMASLYGASDEYHQMFVAGRSATLSDVFFDILGAAFAATALWFLAKMLRGRVAH